MLDKNTIIGLVLIFAIFIGYGILSAPSEEEKAQIKRKQDSIALAKVQALEKEKEGKTIQITDTITTDSAQVENYSSLSSFGAFSPSANGENNTITISNELMDISFSSLGAIVNDVTLKNYKTYYKTNVKIFDKNIYGLNLSVGQNIVRTQDLYFTPTILGKEVTSNINVKKGDSVVLCFRAKTNDTINNGYLEFRYTIRGDDYRVGYDVIFNNLVGIVTDQSSIEMVWDANLRVQEKDGEVEVKNSSIYYSANNDVDYLKENGVDDKVEENGVNIKWITYKQQFFSSALIAKGEGFTSSTMQTITDKILQSRDSSYLRSMNSVISIPFDGEKKQSMFSMDFFYGPNKYSIMSSYDIDMEKIIPLGWGFFLFQWINRVAIIPVFDFLSNFGWNMGIVILVLTILVKIVLFPLAYKSYSSSAKMRILQPQIKKINEKYPKQEQAMDKQKATMALYKRAGINPMAGCLPILLQFPILIAMFRFFPASIELRQQSFLWADDLSSYDSIIDLPFSIPFYGSNVSLFCLLMTIAQIFYTRMTMKQQQSTNQMPGMKFMMYLMPIFMLFILNKYSAALNYYYFVSLCITFFQVWIIGKTVNEKKVLDRLKATEGKPIEKSKWQKRMEDLEKRNRAIMEQRQNMQNKGKAKR
ncbi:MAG: membrane protein insertase YidC [Bacteroidales bacterium]|jgi:YidC/Oxa1 family membrane protein insertase|nr:membrane protein insertase YidC [Bacteroidales bacterium]